MSFDITLAHSNEKSTPSIPCDTNYTFAVTEAFAWCTLYFLLLRLSSEFVCKSGVAACSQSPLWLGFPSQTVWTQLSGAASAPALSKPHKLLHASNHQIPTASPRLLPWVPSLQSCSPISSTASDILRILCLQPLDEWRTNQQLTWFCKWKKNNKIQSWNLAEKHI